jgi:hypothetical protein
MSIAKMKISNGADRMKWESDLSAMDAGRKAFFVEFRGAADCRANVRWAVATLLGPREKTLAAVESASVSVTKSATSASYAAANVAAISLPLAGLRSLALPYFLF